MAALGGDLPAQANVCPPYRLWARSSHRPPEAYRLCNTKRATIRSLLSPFDHIAIARVQPGDLKRVILIRPKPRFWLIRGFSAQNVLRSYFGLINRILHAFHRIFWP